MKEDRFWISRFIGMKFVEKMMARMIWIDQLHEFGAQRLNLIVIQRARTVVCITCRAAIAGIFCR